MRMIKDNEILTEGNIVEAIDKAIRHYFEIGLMVDGMFWREAIRLLKKKHNIKEL